MSIHRYNIHMTSLDVSIIIPVKNNEKTLSRCLNSIFNQKTTFKYEVIIVSDPSIDKTYDIIDEYSRSHDNLIHLKLDKTPIGQARNIGINKSNGDYLMFIDADDYYSSDAINTMVKTIKETDSDIVSASNYYIHKDGKPKKSFFSKNHTYNQKGMLKALMQDSYMHGFMWNKIYKCSLLKNKNYVLPEKNIIREDVLTNFQVFLNADKLTMISKPIYFYDKREESTTSVIDKTRVPWFIEIFAIEKYLLEKNKPQYIKMFNSLKSRRKLLVWGDRQIVKKGYTKNEYKDLKSYCRKYLKIISSNGKLPIDGTPWENFIGKIK